MVPRLFFDPSKLTLGFRAIHMYYGKVSEVKSINKRERENVGGGALSGERIDLKIHIM